MVRRLYTSVLDYFCDNPACETTSYLTSSTPLKSNCSDHTGAKSEPTLMYQWVNLKFHQPPFDVDTEQIIFLREIGFTCKEVSTMLGISRMTLYRKRKQAGITDNNQYVNITTRQLNNIVNQVSQISNPHCC